MNSIYKQQNSSAGVSLHMFVAVDLVVDWRQAKSLAGGRLGVDIVNSFE